MPARQTLSRISVAETVTAGTGRATLVESSFTGRRWSLIEPDPGRTARLSQRLHLPEIVARVLACRDMDQEGATSFLDPRIRDLLPDPSHLLDLDSAVERLARAIRARERVGIIGDYDVDGATSTALLARYLTAFDCPFDVAIPDRLKDGYGPNPGAIDRLADAGAVLLVTLDSGTTAHEALEHAVSRGLDTIVVDHHLADRVLPAALAVINPNRLDQEGPLRHLAAVGVTFVLLVGLNRLLRQHGPVPDLMRWLDLVALGTVCDVVPLHGLNRAFVRQGLKVAAAGANPGMRALGRAAGVEVVREATQFGFAFGPRINAGGRLGRSDLGWKLLVTEDDGDAEGLAAALDELNHRRQQLEHECLKAAERSVETQVEAGRSILVAAADGWHVGVVGIVAARLMERYHRPCFAIGFDGNTGVGSARSVPGIDIGRIVLEAREAGLLVKGGGHPMAAGITIERDKLPAFEQFVDEVGGTGKPPAPLPLDLEGLISPSGVNLDLVEKLGALAPFGAGNPEPLLGLREARIMRPRTVGTGHLSCLIGGPAGGAVKAIAFRAAQKDLDYHLSRDGGMVMLAGKLKREEYRGQVRPSFEIVDAAPMSAETGR